MTQIKKDKIRITIVSLIALAIYAGYGYLLFIIKQKQTQISNTENMITLETQKANEIIALRKTIDSTSDAQKKLSSYFVTSDQTVNFIGTIEQYGKISNTSFSLESVDLNKTTTIKGAADTGAINLHFKAHGSFTNIYRLLLILENAPYAIDFERVSFSKIASDTTTASPEKSAKATPASPLWEGDFTIKLLSFISA